MHFPHDRSQLHRPMLAGTLLMALALAFAGANGEAASAAQPTVSPTTPATPHPRTPPPPASAGATAEAPPAAQPPVPPTPPATPDRLLEPTLPSGPTAADFGAQVFWLHCMPCHGDRSEEHTSELQS